MPSEWSQRLRQLSDLPRNRETLSRLAASAPVNPFRSPSPPASLDNPFADPMTNPFAPPTIQPTPATQYSSPASDTTHLPADSPAATSAPVRPAAVKVAFFGLLTAAAMTLALTCLGVYAIFELRNTVNNVLNLDPTGTAIVAVTGYADNTQIALTVAAAALGAALTVAYLLVARAIWKGRSWPRKISPFLAILSLPAVFIGHIAPIAVIAGIIATAAAWMPSARAFARQRRAHAAATRASRRGAAATT